jgi:general secretion pathway protein G
MRHAWHSRLQQLRTVHPAFTMLEIMVVIVIVGILAAIVVPQFGNATSDAKASALKSGLGGWRSSVAAFRTRAVLAGTSPYPTLSQITTTGLVLQGEAPVNPFNGKNTVQSVSAAQANARAVVNEITVGWNYYVDNSANPPVAILYANSDDLAETVDGTPRTANQF